MPTADQLVGRRDRFRSYAILLKLASPWLDLQQFVAQDAHESVAIPASGSKALSAQVRLATDLCVAFHTQDYARFFRLYRRVCEPTSTDDYDPIVACLLQPYVR